MQGVARLRLIAKIVAGLQRDGGRTVFDSRALNLIASTADYAGTPDWEAIPLDYTFTGGDDQEFLNLRAASTTDARKDMALVLRTTGPVVVRLYDRGLINVRPFDGPTPAIFVLLGGDNHKMPNGNPGTQSLEIQSAGQLAHVSGVLLVRRQATG